MDQLETVVQPAYASHKNDAKYLSAALKIWQKSLTV
jgi:hypothetical protein